MQPSNNKVDSQPRSQQRKYQYFGGTSVTTNPNLTASSIDQHRNSIEQRIANLQQKLAKKFSPQIQCLIPSQAQSDNYVNTRRMYQYSGTGSEQQFQQKKYLTGSQTRLQLGFPNTRQPSSTQGPNPYNYLNNDFKQYPDEIALREKYKFSTIENREITHHHLASRQPGNKLKAMLQKSTNRIEPSLTQKPLSSTKDRVIGKKIKNIAQTKKQNRKNLQETKFYQSHQKFDRKYPLSVSQTPYHEPSKKGQSIPRQNLILNNRYLQDNFNQLNTHISSLKNYTATGASYNYPLENYRSHVAGQSRTISYDTGLNTSQTNNQKNNELYQMMKSIMVGQERLEKQLIILKSNQQNVDNSRGLNVDNSRGLNLAHSKSKNQDSIQPYLRKTEKDKTHPGIKNNNIPESRLMSPIHQRPEQKPSHTKPHTVQNTQSRSPQSQIRKSKSPRASKSPRQASRSPGLNKSGHQTTQTSAIKRKRVNSAVVEKKVAGKIQKNKQRFYELYKQAQTNKKLSQGNTRISISNNVLSSVWQKIKQSITQAESQDAETSVIYHENNRSVNDHLVSKIELQKKLKNDLVKKVYEMCENKCLFK